MQKGFPITIEQAEFEQLEVVPNETRSRKIIQIIDPEFSSVCPRSGLPDYARIILRYIPDEHLIELKSWKLYLRDFYGVGAFHEDVTQEICDEFTETVKPRWMAMVFDWGARGGLHTTTKMVWTQHKGYQAWPDDWNDPLLLKSAKGWNNS